MHATRPHRIAAIVPCHNEEAAVAKVVTDLRASVPGITVYVYDNCSTDRTAERARAAGAVVRHEAMRGKGNVVRRAFGDIDADIYLLIDGDDTYDATAAPELIQTLLDGPYDHVLGVRREAEGTTGAYRPAHATGNRVLNRLVEALFGQDPRDMLSGYRVFSKRFVKSFPAASREFEIETELTVHCLALRIPSTAVEVGFGERADGSESKLRTYRDGWRILSIILNLTRHERPLAFFGLLSAVSALLGTGLLAPVVVSFTQTGLVERLPTFMLGLMLVGLSFLGVLAGLVLDGIRKTRHEQSRLRYLERPALSQDALPLTLAPIAVPPQRDLRSARHDVVAPVGVQ